MKRFWDKVQKTDTCWLWLACVAPNGYGLFYYEGKLSLRELRKPTIDLNTYSGNGKRQ